MSDRIDHAAESQASRGPWEQEISREPTPRRRGVYPISICGCWWIVDRLSPCPSHTNPEETP